MLCVLITYIDILKYHYDIANRTYLGEFRLFKQLKSSSFKLVKTNNNKNRLK